MGMRVVKRWLRRMQGFNVVSGRDFVGWIEGGLVGNVLKGSLFHAKIWKWVWECV